MRGAARLLALSVCLFGLCAPARAQEIRTAKVTYVTGSSVYVDAGQAEGLQPGMRLELLREGSAVAVVEVKDVSTHRSVCTIVERSEEPAIGDQIQFAPVMVAAPSAAAAAPPPTQQRRQSNWLRGIGIRGRAGVRYLVVNDGMGDGGYSQPALDLRLDGTQVAGSNFGFSVDVRSRRIYRQNPGLPDEDQTRLYRLAAGWGKPDGSWAFTAGRQFSPRMAVISIFDGIAAEYRGKWWGAGVITGTQPDPEDFGFSSLIREHGFYFRFHGRQAPRRGWEVVTGAIGSYVDGVVNREFMYLQAQYRTNRFWSYLSQEIDYNRDWKIDEAGEDTVTPTSTFLSLGYDITDGLSLRGGYDNRRNVRLLRDRVTPITDFDDEFRQGIWIGAWYRFLRRFQVGVDARTNGGDSAGDSEAYSAVFGVNGITRWNFGANVRASSFANETVEGLLFSLDVGIDLGSRVRLQLYGGRRDEENLATLPLENVLDWYGVYVDFALGRRWFLLLEAERTDGDTELVDQYYTTLAYRF